MARQTLEERIKQLGYLHPDKDGIVKSVPAHLELRYFGYKLFGVLFLVWSLVAFN